MNYQETLDYIFHKLPMYSRMGVAAYRKDLTNIKVLCEHLGNPQQSFKTIHVAGTNGKGSVSHMLAAVLQTAGYKTGLYTSPHLYDFRERIRMNGEVVSTEFVVQFVEKIKPLIEEIEPSFFEITVAMAFAFFAEQRVDVAVIEVGLGGRLDSTNIITPELSVITNIGWDHMNLLGNSLAEIAGEKAGIIKNKVPVVVGETLPDTISVFQRIAAERNAPIILAEFYAKVLQQEWTNQFLDVTFAIKDGGVLRLSTDLTGIYQVANLRTVLASVDKLVELGWQIDREVFVRALLNVKGTTGLMGRWDVLQQKPLVILDVAHNEAGVRKMMEHVRQLAVDRLHIVIGLVKDKDVEAVLSILPPAAAYYFTQATIPRALPAAALKEKAASFDLNGEAYADVNLALNAAKSAAAKEDCVLVCGSIFLVAEVSQR